MLSAEMGGAKTAIKNRKTADRAIVLDGIETLVDAYIDLGINASNVKVLSNPGELPEDYFEAEEGEFGSYNSYRRVANTIAYSGEEGVLVRTRTSTKAGDNTQDQEQFYFVPAGADLGKDDADALRVRIQTRQQQEGLFIPIAESRSTVREQTAEQLSK